MKKDTQKLRRIQADSQTNIFEPAPFAKKEPAQITRGFVDRDPTDIALGGVPLKQFLERTKMDAPLIVREVLGRLDYSKFTAKYSLNGRAPYHPRVMLGLIVYGIMKGQTSLRQLEEVAALDVGAMWITGGVFPDHSTIGRFVQQHNELITVSFFEHLTMEILKEVGATQVWSGDGTVMDSSANRFKMLKLEAAREEARKLAEELGQVSHDGSDNAEPSDGSDNAEPSDGSDNAEPSDGSDNAEPSDGSDNAEPSDAPDDAASDLSVSNARKTAKLELLKQAIKVGEEREVLRKKNNENTDEITICTTDPEAGVIKNKRGNIGPAYVPSIITSERLILSATVHPFSEIRVLRESFKQALRVAEETTAIMLLDASYHSVNTAKEAEKCGLLLISPAPNQQTHAKPSKFFNKHLNFTFLSKENAYRCMANMLLAYSYAYTDSRNGAKRLVFRPSKDICKDCELQAQCTTTSRRTVSRHADEIYLERMRALYEDEAGRAIYKQRAASVEPVFGELRGIQGLTRFRRKGLRNVNVEFALHACAHNLRRLQIHRRRRRLFYALQALFMRIWPFIMTQARSEDQNDAIFQNYALST